MPFKDPEKRKEYAKKYYKKYSKLSKAIKYQHKWRDNNPEKTKEYCKKYRAIHLEDRRKSDREQQRKLQRKRKTEIFSILNGQCANPYGLHDKLFTDIRCLQIDHINGGGTKEHNHICYSSFLKIVLEKLKSGSKDYQLLCANCNQIKKFENHEDGRLRS